QVRENLLLFKRHKPSSATLGNTPEASHFLSILRQYVAHSAHHEANGYIFRDEELPAYWRRAARSAYAIPHCCKRLTSSAATPASRNCCAASHTFPPLISPYAWGGA